MLQTLEEQLGFALFVRSHRKLTPTPEARFFLEECDDILARVERTERVLHRISTLSAGTLQIACHPAAAHHFVPRLLTGFLADKPDLQVSLMMRSSELIEELIASQQFDLGFAEVPRPRNSIEQIDFDLECVCVLAADDPLAAHAVITPADLDGRPMAVLFEAHGTTRQADAAFQAAGCRFHKRVELRTFETGLPFVAAGLTVMLCDMITAYSHLLQTPPASRLAIRRFRPRISSGVSILTPAYTNRSLVGAAFIAELQAGLARMQNDIETALAPVGREPDSGTGFMGAEL